MNSLRRHGWHCLAAAASGQLWQERLRKNTARRTECQAAPCVAIVGDIFIDIVAPIKKLPLWDSDVEAETVKIMPGGSALNQGRQLHALGVKVHFMGAVGKDAMGRTLLEQVSGQGFPTEGIKIFSNLPSSVCIVLSGPADRAFVSCYSSTDAFTTRDLREQAALIEGCAHFHLGGYFNMKGLQTQDFTEFAKSCRQRKLTLSLNLQYDASGHWCGEDGHLADLLNHIDLLFVNASEGEHVCAALCAGEDKSVFALCKKYRQLMIVVTQGAHGATAYRDSMAPIHVPCRQARVVDATGAGDAFVAGFLSSWLLQKHPEGSEAEHKAIVDACKKGSAVARVCLGREGGCVEPVRPRDLE